MLMSSVQVPTLRSYAHALEHYEKAIPYKKGDLKGKKPIGRNRRYKACLIEKIEGTEVVVATLYGAHVVSFYPNGEVHVSLGKYDSQSTRGFIESVTGFRCYAKTNSTYLCVGEKAYAFHDSETPLIVKDKEVQNAKQEKTYKLDRKAIAAKRQEYAPFLDYVKGMGGVMEVIPATEVERMLETYNSYGGASKPKQLILPSMGARYMHGRENLLEQLRLFLLDIKEACVADNLEQMCVQFYRLGVSALRYDYYKQGYRAEYIADASYAPISKPMVEFFDEVLKFVFKGELFVEELAPIGSSKSNANRRYFS